MTWRDIDISLDYKHDGDIRDNEGIDAIKNSIINIFKTFQGSRRMVPSFALPIFNLLFEQIDEITLDSLETRIFHAIELWEDRIYVTNLKVKGDPDNNKIDVKLEFRLRNDVSDKIYNINETLVMQ
jgi:phage baseplate assembly protein W